MILFIFCDDGGGGGGVVVVVDVVVVVKARSPVHGFKESDRLPQVAVGEPARWPSAIPNARRFDARAAPPPPFPPYCPLSRFLFRAPLLPSSLALSCFDTPLVLIPSSLPLPLPLLGPSPGYLSESYWGLLSPLYFWSESTLDANQKKTKDERNSHPLDLPTKAMDCLCYSDPCLIPPHAPYVSFGSDASLSVDLLCLLSPLPCALFLSLPPPLFYLLLPWRSSLPMPGQLPLAGISGQRMWQPSLHSDPRNVRWNG
ncbi:uncharacterized protein BO80DRAFT_261040 [Aspergillus ibericus CBS 121593]|uniref:Uncharacterized protein n=1 Tax=Aspergillus ibericus CBS 121593 TaxID=1448316 RepID=A0A395GJL2_9EURO|nr:hypothetical protein BO80DRAFT_261040 [Aspergillus ibericus CBS 121593]RAK95554.1 hypothetical protein BO80DRAFT_261040 [Aspergillus ibericus CBS 121593]